jgi:hypothetical protein
VFGHDGESYPASNNPPAEPGALRFGPLEAAREVANATSRM